jgi:hypothetical protein
MPFNGSVRKFKASSIGGPTRLANLESDLQAREKNFEARVPVTFRFKFTVWVDLSSEKRFFRLQIWQHTQQALKVDWVRTQKRELHLRRYRVGGRGSQRFLK